MKCGIITPIGPGHRALFEQSCRASVERAMGYSKGPFDEIVHYAMDDGEGRHGRSNRRNAAIVQALSDGVEWLFLLDADDVLAPNAFETFGRRIAEEPEIDALWGLICEYDDDGEPQLRNGQAETLDSYADFLATAPYLAVQIGAFIRTSKLASIGFDETMDTGEDYKLYLQLWKNAVCRKRPEIFFINRRGQHSTGPRSASGQDWNRVVDRLWADAVSDHPIWGHPTHDGIAARMRVTNPLDLIQRTHIEGRFFEADSLEKLKRLVRPGARIIEVGANIGNHVVWYAQHLAPASILPVEPNPAAIKLLEENIEANEIADIVDRRGIGIGAGRVEGRYSAVTENRDNLGATKLVSDAQGDLSVVPLDRLVGEDPVDFIKIDAEGMELDVLAGAAGVIARDRPVIWVEILRGNILPFAQKWCRENGYHLADSVAYVNTMDYFAVPEERA